MPCDPWARVAAGRRTRSARIGRMRPASYSDRLTGGLHLGECRETHDDFGSSRTRTDVDLGVVRVGDPAGDGQAEAGSLPFTAGAFTAVEALKDVGQLVGRNPDAGIDDAYGRGAVLQARVDPHAPSRRRELDGVVEENPEQLAQGHGVAAHRALLESAHR